MTRSTGWQLRLVRAVLLWSCLLAWAPACSAAPKAAVRLWTFQHFTVELPADWTCRTFGTGDQHDAFWGLTGEGARCQSAGGTFFDVVTDIGIDMPAADSYWTVKPLPDGRVSVTEKPLCKKEPPGTPPTPLVPPCPAGDGRLDIFASFEAGGHVYVLGLGNQSKESNASLPELRRALETFRYR